MDLSCGSVSSDELDAVISSSTGASNGRILREESKRKDQPRAAMHSQDVRPGSGDSGKPLTPAQELRKATKPLMEKRRRARINQCLQELKDLILEALNKDPARHNKLEKADILEMAVCHLKSVQRQVRQPPTLPIEGTTKYRDGYTECANEVSRFVNNVQVLQPDVKQKLIGHLSSCINTLDTSNGPSVSPPLGYPLTLSPASQPDQQGQLPPALPAGERSSSPLSYSPYPPLSPPSHRSSPPLPPVAPSFPSVAAPLNLSPSHMVAFPGMVPPPSNDLNNNVNNVTSSSTNNNNHMSVGLNLVSKKDHRNPSASMSCADSTGGSFGDEPMDDDHSPATAGLDDGDQYDAPLDFSKKIMQASTRTSSSSSINSTGGGSYGGGGPGSGSSTTVFPNPRKKYLASVSSGASSSSDESVFGTTPHGSVSSANELDFQHTSSLRQLQEHQNQPVNYSKNAFGGASAPRYNFVLMGGDSGIVSEDDDDVWRPWHFQR